MIVPNCPSGVVFHREDFLHDAFTVDNFLAKYAEGNFEMLRDELGMYLQVLRVAMIELINDDYADFVNLSSNLVGIEDKIQAVESPLNEFKVQILDFQQKLKLTKCQLEEKLEKRKSLHEKRVALRNLEHIIVTLNKVERLLKLGSNDELELTGDLVERVASDVNYLNHCVAKCEATAFVQEIKPRINLIGMFHYVDYVRELQYFDFFDFTVLVNIVDSGVFQAIDYTPLWKINFSMLCKPTTPRCSKDA